MYKPMVSIIVPTYNEAEDIRQTLEKLVSLQYSNNEIIVIDESKDSTPEIVREFTDRGVRLILQKEKTNYKGRCAARNVGILEASGEIVIILNADVRLPFDFIERILPHYEKGADYVLVEAEVSNQEFLFPRYINAQHHFRYDNQEWINWTEGSSCRRDSVIEVGLFPDKFPVPLESGEDGIFGEKLEKKGRKVIDKNIVVTHKAPHTLRGFWNQRKERGKWPQVAFFIQGMSKREIRLSIIKGGISIIIAIISLYKPLLYAYRVSAFSCKGRKDLFPFLIAHILELVGGFFGAVEAYKSLKSVEVERWVI